MKLHCDHWIRALVRRSRPCDNEFIRSRNIDAWHCEVLLRCRRCGRQRYVPGVRHSSGLVSYFD
jgi:hypothetical protein